MPSNFLRNVAIIKPASSDDTGQGMHACDIPVWHMRLSLYGTIISPSLEYMRVSKRHLPRDHTCKPTT